MSQVTSCARSTPEQQRRISASSACIVAPSNARAVPVRVTASGTTLNASPPLIEPMVTTAMPLAWIRRAGIASISGTSAAAADIGLAVRCGVAAWPPRPRTSTWKRAAPAQAGPACTAAVPSGSGGALCSANTASQGKRSNRPASIIARAPPRPSSAGWKIRLTVPAKSRRPASIRAAPSSMAVWPSCPQACISPGRAERCGAWPRSSIGSASISARSPMLGAAAPGAGSSPRITPTTPVPPSPTWVSMPQARSRSATKAAVSTSSKPSSGCW